MTPMRSARAPRAGGQWGPLPYRLNVWPTVGLQPKLTARPLEALAEGALEHPDYSSANLLRK